MLSNRYVYTQIIAEIFLQYCITRRYRCGVPGIIKFLSSPDCAGKMISFRGFFHLFICDISAIEN